MKKLLLSLLGALITLPTMARDFTYTYEGQTITYTVIDEKAKTCITHSRDYGKPGNSVSGDLVLPSKVYDGDTKYTLISIGKSAFSGCSGLISVTIPNSVTSIGDNAFYHCSGLTSVTIPNSVNSIGKSAFGYCKGLTGELIIPNSVNSIGESAFVWCSGLTSVTIPNSITSIDSSAFAYCSGLTSVTFPNSITYIGQKAFYRCSGITSIDIPNSVTYIGDEAFNECSGIVSVVLPSSVTYIGLEAFNKCSGIKEVINCTSDECNVSHSAFWNCYNISRIIIASNVKLLDSFSGIMTYPTVYTFEQLFNEIKHHCKFDCNVIAMPGIEVSSTSKFDEITLSVTEAEGVTLNKVECDNATIKPKSGTYILSDLCPDTDYYVTFDISNEYLENIPLSSKFSTNHLDIFKSISLVNATQNTLTFKATLDSDKRISNAKICVDDQEAPFGKDGTATIKNLNSNSEYSIYGIANFKDKTYSSIDYLRVDAKTLKINPQVLAELTPTMIIMRPTLLDIGDAKIKSETLKINGNEYNIREHQFINQPLGQEFYAEYLVNNEKYSRTFKLPTLTLNPLAARAASKDCAIICAETNMSEEEYGGGFEWRRYDAPDLVPSTFSPCPVANGHMEGRLKGLNPNTYYKYRPYYEDCNGDRTFGEWIAFITADADVYFEPTVYTYNAHTITKNGATLVGYAIGGSEDVDEQGFEYWPISGSRSTTDVKRVLVSGQRMIVTLDDLEPGTRYAVRAFVTTKTKTTYGEKQEFETEADPNGSIQSPQTDINETTPFDVFTLTGVRVRRQTTDLSGLQRGIYIANGRKIFVR